MGPQITLFKQLQDFRYPADGDDQPCPVPGRAQEFFPDDGVDEGRILQLAQPCDVDPAIRAQPLELSRRKAEQRKHALLRVDRIEPIKKEEKISLPQREVTGRNKIRRPLESLLA